MFVLKSVIFSLTISNFFVIITGDLIVTLPQGQIRGRELKNENNVKFYAFQEVPFAAPPVGKLRFQAPVDPENWEGVLNTTENTKVCYQLGLDFSMENEDCLYLNVYTPVKPGVNADRPVLVFIHGGAFVMGIAIYYAYGPEYFIDYDVIIVTVNYRLGAFGFLSTEDTVVPGNIGLKDQLHALKWVQKNIHLFGGDPSKVTINGQSAGGSSVGLHVISKQSSGLFRAAIMESGSSICSWVYQSHPKSVAVMLAQAINSSFSANASSLELLEFLQSVPASKIDSTILNDTSGPQIGQGDIFAPVIEVQHDEAFLTDLMHEDIKNGKFNKVPIIIGFNSEEKIFLASDLNALKKIMIQFDDDLRLIVNNDYNVAEADKFEVGALIKKIYTEGKFQDDLGASVRFQSDARYTTSIIRHAYLQSNYTDVYIYEFSYHGKLGDNNVSIAGADRVSHSEEIKYIWHTLGIDLSQYPAEDLLTHDRLLKMWTDFVKHLNPTPEESELLQNVTWPVASPENMQYLNINGTLEVKVDPKEYKAWAEIVDKYGNPPFVTY